MTRINLLNPWQGWLTHQEAGIILTGKARRDGYLLVHDILAVIRIRQGLDSSRIRKVGPWKYLL